MGSMERVKARSQILHKCRRRQRFQRLPEFRHNAICSWLRCFDSSIVKWMWKQERFGSSRSSAKRPGRRGHATRAKAQLAQAEAQLGKTQLDVQRDTPLAKEKAIAQSQLDNDIQANLAAKASVEADKAAVEQAELNLEFTNVRSLIDGIAGIASGQVGNLVSPQILLTTVSQLEPIKAYFTVSEQQYLAFVKRNPTVAAREARERQFELDLILADGSTYPRKGKFYAADRQVDIQTGAIRLAALFPNPDNVLRPGQFGRVRFVSYIRTGALLVPQKAVIELQGSYQVAVVGNDNKVTLKTMKVGERTGAMWIVDEGLKPGERVVVEGVQKVRDSMLVKPTLTTATVEGN